MLKVGLTGGIACGKSNALRSFSRLGAHTIDADVIAREVVEPGKPAYKKILESFGAGIIQDDGQLNRHALAAKIFADEDLRKRLNEITHPYILEEEAKRIQKISQLQGIERRSAIVTDAALMIEVGTYEAYDFLVVAYCPPAVQFQRLMSRDEMTEEEANLRIKSQMPLLDKARHADYVIDTTGKLSDTFNQVRHIYIEMLRRFEDES